MIFSDMKVRFLPEMICNKVRFLQKKHLFLVRFPCYLYFSNISIISLPYFSTVFLPIHLTRRSSRSFFGIRLDRPIMAFCWSTVYAGSPWSAASFLRHSTSARYSSIFPISLLSNGIFFSVFSRFLLAVAFPDFITFLKFSHEPAL